MAGEYTRPDRVETAGVTGPANAALTLSFIKLIIGALAERSMVWAALLGSLGMWGYAMYIPDLMHVATAGGFTATVLLPLLFKKGR